MLSCCRCLECCRFSPKHEIPWTQASISDYDAILPAFQGIDTVVHMARDADFGIAHMSGTVHVLEACRACGVKRVIYASSGELMLGYEYDDSQPYGRLAANKHEEVPAVGAWRQVWLHNHRPRPTRRLVEQQSSRTSRAACPPR